MLLSTSEVLYDIWGIFQILLRQANLRVKLGNFILIFVPQNLLSFDILKGSCCTYGQCRHENELKISYKPSKSFVCLVLRIVVV